MENNSQGYKRCLWVVAPLLLVIGLVWALPAHSADARLIPFQGRLTNADGTPLKNDVYRITFVIYDKPTGGTALWSEVHPTVSVLNGQLNVLLGSMVSLDDPDGNGNPSDAVHFSVSRFLGIKVGLASNQEMVPRHQLVPSFHARIADRALLADGVANEGVTSPMIESNAVKTSHIQNGTIQEEDLAPALAAAMRNTVPAGAIILWDGGACPPGFRDLTAYHSKFLVGSDTTGIEGGANTHDHGGNTGSHALTVAEMPAHRHLNASLSPGGSNFAYNATDGRTSSPDRVTSPDANELVGGGQGHSHTILVADNRPAFRTIKLCKKD